MHRSTRALVFTVTVLILLGAGLQPAEATCGNGRIITTLHYNVDERSYLYTPGVCDAGVPCPTTYYSSVTGYVDASFWALGYGNPAPLAGIDNGSFDENPATSYYLIPYAWPDAWLSSDGYFYPAGISTNWAGSQEIDGCIDAVFGTRCTAILVSDRANDTGYFALLTKAADGLLNYEFARPDGAPFDLAPIPVPLVVSGSQSTMIEVLVPTLGGTEDGLYLDPACNTVPSVVGYKVHGRIIPEGSAPPPGRDVSQWTLLSSSTTPLGQTTEIAVSCDVGEAVVLATSLVFDSGFETSFVSANSESVPCCTSPDSDGDGFCGDADCDDTVATCAVDCVTDTDGDGAVDCNDPCVDGDGDDYGTSVAATNTCLGDDCDDANPYCNTDCTDADLDGFCASVDCRDASCSSFPGAEELLDGLDNDCDGLADEGLDDDRDGVPNLNDVCPDTPGSSGVGPDGCTRCSRLCSQTRDIGAFVLCIRGAVGQLVDALVLTDEEGQALVESAERRRRAADTSGSRRRRPGTGR